MSLLGEVLAEVLSSLLGGAFGPKEATSYPEGLLNASLAAISGFCGSLALLVSIIAVLEAVFGFKDLHIGAPLILLLGFIGGLGGYGALRLGRKALQVTKRNLGLAKFGIGVSVMAVWLSIAASLLAVAGLVWP